VELVVDGRIGAHLLQRHHVGIDAPHDVQDAVRIVLAVGPDAGMDVVGQHPADRCGRRACREPPADNLVDRP
jgi:hypothetical protein